MNLKELLNNYGSNKEPFLFIIDFDLKNYEVIPLDKLPENIRYNFGYENKTTKKINIKKFPLGFNEYCKKFQKVQKNIREGNTYLLNLTSETKIETQHSLKDIYENAKGKFKLLYKDRFVCFSPERFVEIKENKISTYPMKGTIDADIKNARDIILNDQKELAEHTMVVDLLRNDLSIVSKNVKVEKFRYIEKIEAGEKKLLQVSSKISGVLEENWNAGIGDILLPLLPAGSITGTPKKKTIEIIKDTENYNRGFFTGVFGIYDGKKLDSAVMIRYIEKKDDQLLYRSGGGVTCDSMAENEYNEMCDKVYIP